MLDLKALLSKILNPPVAAKGNASGRINLFGLLIQWGSNTQAVSSSSTVSWNTTFGKAYAYTPILFTQIVNTSAPATFHVSANNITTTGCTWLRQSSSSTSYNCTIHWVAIGFSNGGGYLTSKLYAICSHLERWWEHVRFKGFVDENIGKLCRYKEGYCIGINRWKYFCKWRVQRCNNTIYTTNEKHTNYNPNSHKHWNCWVPTSIWSNKHLDKWLYNSSLELRFGRSISCRGVGCNRNLTLERGCLVC